MILWFRRGDDDQRVSCNLEIGRLLLKPVNSTKTTRAIGSSVMHSSIICSDGISRLRFQEPYLRLVDWFE